MEPQVNALFSSLGLLALAFVGFYLYPTIRIEQFRQKVFVLRAKLFDAVHAEPLSRTDKPYEVIRTMMNGFLRDAERIGLWDMAFYIVVRKQYDIDGSFAQSILNPALDSVSNQKRVIYNGHLNELNFLVLDLMIKRSILVYLPIKILLIASILRSSVKPYIMKQLNKALPFADDQAYKIGQAAPCSASA